MHGNCTTCFTHTFSLLTLRCASFSFDIAAATRCARNCAFVTIRGTCASAWSFFLFLGAGSSTAVKGPIPFDSSSLSHLFCTLTRYVSLVISPCMHMLTNRDNVFAKTFCAFLSYTTSCFVLSSVGFLICWFMAKPGSYHMSCPFFAVAWLASPKGFPGCW